MIDLSLLNDYIQIPKFEMDTPQKVLSSEKGQYAFSLHLVEAYFQTAIHPSSRKFLRMEFLGAIFQYRAQLFGISMAPWLFTKVVSVVKKLFHQDRLCLLQYVDDELRDTPSKQEAQARSHLLVKICGHLGFLRVCKNTLQPVPRQSLHYRQELGQSHDHCQGPESG